MSAPDSATDALAEHTPAGIAKAASTDAGTAKATSTDAGTAKAASTDVANSNAANAGPETAQAGNAETENAEAGSAEPDTGNAKNAGDNAEPGTTARRRLPPRLTATVDITFRFAGGVIAVLAAFLSGLLELFFIPLRVGGVLIAVAALVAVPVNVAIAWFAVRTVGRRWALGPPWAVWTLLMFFAVGTRTAEGDYLVAGDNWAGLILVLLGSLAFGVYAYRLILRGHPPR